MSDTINKQETKSELKRAKESNLKISESVKSSSIPILSNTVRGASSTNGGTTSPPSPSTSPLVRDQMKQYWAQFQASEESMMLCSAANAALAEEDRVQILKVCPSIDGKRVLELGSGIGRFTTELAKRAESVVTVDFMESYVQLNRERNKHFSNIEFLTADVTEIGFPEHSYDVIFSNWLLMYIGNEELDKLVVKMLSWLKIDGHVFVRESCYKPSGDKPRRNNPTFYRSPLEYFHILQNNLYVNTKASRNTINKFCFVCHRALSIEAYIRHYGNPFQLAFVLRKMPHSPDSYNSFQAFLDGHQYTEEGIRRYEFMFGKTFVSTGGQETTEEFVKTLQLTKDEHVLDVGCGIGGSAFYIARMYGSRVHGVDLSSNMVHMAVKYQAEMEEKVRKNVSFEMSDITKHDFESNSFDVIYSRDTILHIGDKNALFKKFFKWLKPGGKLMISDYCRGDKDDHSEGFVNYVLQRGYHLMSVPEYGSLLEEVGFTDVVADDRTCQFIEILEMELHRFRERKLDFLRTFKEADYDYIAEGWKLKMIRCGNGDQAWGLFTAHKPLL